MTIRTACLRIWETQEQAITFFWKYLMSIQLTAVFVFACVVQSVAIAEPVPPIPKTTYEIIDDLSYSPQTAQTSWRPMTGSKSVSLVEIEGTKALKMPCNFHGTKFDRSSWDRELKLDLTMCKGLQRAPWRRSAVL